MCCCFSTNSFSTCYKIKKWIKLAFDYFMYLFIISPGAVGWWSSVSHFLLKVFRAVSQPAAGAGLIRGCRRTGCPGRRMQLAGSWCYLLAGAHGWELIAESNCMFSSCTLQVIWSHMLLKECSWSPGWVAQLVRASSRTPQKGCGFIPIRAHT